MREEPELTKAELMKQIDTSWKALQATLDELTATQLTSAKDAAGWGVKDHVMHIALWERSVNYLLQGRPRHVALGVDEELYRKGPEEALNNAIFEQYAALPADKALARLRDVHAETMALLKPLTEADLRLPYRAYLPHEAGEGEGQPVINVVYGDTAGHFAEHLPWIQALAKRST